MILNLTYYTGPAWSGFAEGARLRAEHQLDHLDLTPDPVELVVPDELVSINSSFFDGLFSPSLDRLGETAFRKKYKILNTRRFDEDFDSGIGYVKWRVPRSR